jgi:hypothetical protein
MARISFEEFSGGKPIISSKATTTPAAPATNPNSAGADLSRGFQGGVDALNRGIDREVAQGQEGRGFVSRQFGRLMNGLGTAGEIVGSNLEGVFRAIPGGTTAANVTEGVVGGAVGMAANSQPGQAAIGATKSAFNSLPEGAQTALEDTGRGAVGALQLGGALTAPGAANTATKRAFSSVDDAIRAIPERKFAIAPKRAGDLINKYRAQLSNIDPRYETVLKQQKDPAKVMSYFDQAEKAAIDPSAPMATKIASDRAVEAYESIDRGLNEAGRLKADLLDGIADKKLTGNIAGEAIDNVKTTIRARYGIEIDKDGTITVAPGRMASVDAKSQALIKEYVSMLRQLGQAPSARKLDDFVDASQRMLYKQSSPNLFDVADEPVIAFLKQQTGEVNDKLKSSVDDVLRANGRTESYAELNAKYSQLYSISEDLNKRLGKEGDKGASMMKALYSPQTGEPTRRLFQQIKDETGIDLFEESTLAKFAMESVGDTRSKSLLQQLDALAGDVSKVNLMEPGSWLNYIREKADLDGRDLAETIIKQANPPKPINTTMQSFRDGNPSPQGGYIGNSPRQAPKGNQRVSSSPSVPKLTAEMKSNLVDILDDYYTKGGKNLQLQEDAARMAEDLGIPMPSRYGDLVKKLGEILDAAERPKRVN